MVQLDRYAAAVALTELAPGPVTPETAAAVYEAQIIVARTYAASRRGRHAAEGFDLCDTTHCQRYEPARLDSARWARLAAELAARTSGRVLWHDGAPIEAVFHADCGGHTASAADVWGGARPYLVGRPDDLPDDAEDAHRQWSSALQRRDLEAALRRDDRLRSALPLREIAVARRDPSGRAARVRLAGAATVEVEGEAFRAAVTAALGPRAMPSTRFTIAAVDGGWRADGSGFGHGVGLCQAGALARARNGVTAARILSFYYPGAIIRRLTADS